MLRLLCASLLDSCLFLHKQITLPRSGGSEASNWDTVVKVIALDGADLKERDQCPAEYPLNPDSIRPDNLSQNLTMVCLSVCLSVNLSVFLYIFLVCLFDYLFIRLFICLSVYLSFCLSVRWTVNVSVCRYIEI